MLAAAATALSASCYCGAVRLCVDVSKPPLSVSICHCTTCRRLTGASFLTNLMLPAEALTIEPADAALITLQTSKHVSRHRCASCCSPVYATLGKGRVVVPASLFDPPPLSSWKPQHHLYYDRRVFDLPDDGLPKYRTHYGSALWAGEPMMAADAQPESE